MFRPKLTCPLILKMNCCLLQALIQVCMAGEKEPDMGPGALTPNSMSLNTGKRLETSLGVFDLPSEACFPG